MIIKNIAFLLISASVLTACSSEKVTVSPLYDSFPNGNVFISNFPNRDFNDKKGEIYHASELVNNISAIPTFTNAPVNNEIQHLKTNVRNYIYALESYNVNGKKGAVEEIEKSYKKIQKLRKSLARDEDEVLNRFLVKIKSGIAALDYPAGSSGI